MMKQTCFSKHTTFHDLSGNTNEQWCAGSIPASDRHLQIKNKYILIKKVFLIINILLSAICFHNCGNKENKIINKETKVYKIENFNEDFFQWDELVNNVEFIQLETSKNSVIGQISKGIVDGNDIYIHDYKNQLLLNFDAKGNFIRKCGQRGKGPNEFKEVRDFCISNGNLYTLDYKKILCYSRKSGEVIDTWTIDTENGFNPGSFIIFNKNEYYLWNSNPDVWKTNKGDYFRLRKIKKNHIDFEFFKYEYKTSCDPRFYDCGEGTYYVMPVDGEYVIHKLNKDSVFTSFSLDFGIKSLTPEKINELRNNGKPNAYLKSDSFKGISNILETTDYIYFKCIGPDSKIYEAVINKKTSKVKFGRWDYNRSPRFFYTDGNVLYGYYEPNTLLEQIDDNNKFNTCFNKIREKQKDIKISDNLILVKLYLK